MQVVIPDALPAPAVARDLARLLPERAPTLLAWMRAAAARVERIDPATEGCTPFEAWQLRQAGFRPDAGQPLGAGMGPLHAGERRTGEPGQPVWVAELSHVALGTDHASLLDPEALVLDPDEGTELFRAAAPLFEGTGFHAGVLTPRRWQIGLPRDMVPRTVTPQAVAGRAIDAWWPQQDSLRPWRRLLNEIQMVWHDHPVNRARAERGDPPVNSLWLYGGARPWPAPAARASAPRIFGALHGAACAGDWNAWLDALARLDREALRPLAARLPGSEPALTLTLTGRERLATLDLRRRHRLLAWLPRPDKNWNAWWNLPD